MRKFFIALSAVVASMAAVSCMEEKVLEPDAQEGEYVELTAGFEAGETKTTLDPTSFAVKWDAVDKISVSDGGEGKAAKTAEFSIKTGTISTDGTSATFEGNLVGTPKLAFYPAKNAEIWHEDGVKAKLPAKQQAVADSFDPDAAVAIATIADSKASFKNIGALLGVKIMNDNIKSVQVISNTNTPLAGFARVKVETDGTVTNTAASSNSVTLEGDFVKGKTYYMVVYPGEHTKGFKLIYTDKAGNTAIYKSSATCTLARNGNMILAAMPVASSYVLIKDVASLQDGDVLVLGRADLGKVMTEYYASKERFSVGAATVIDGVLTSAANVTPCEVTLKQNGANWRLISNGKEIKAVNSDLSLAEPNTGSDWTIAINPDNFEATISETTIAGRNLAFGSTPDYIKNYISTDSQFKKVEIYRLEIGKLDPDIPAISISQPVRGDDGKYSIKSVPGAGSSATIKYSLSGMIPEGTMIKAVSSENWVSDFNLDKVGEINFKIQKNEGAKRNATVTISLQGAQSVEVYIEQLQGENYASPEQKYTLTLNKESIKQRNAKESGYAAYDGDHVVNAIGADGNKFPVTLSLKDVMVNGTKIQMKKSTGLIQCKTDLVNIETKELDITSVKYMHCSDAKGTPIKSDVEGPFGFFKIMGGDKVASFREIVITFTK